MKRTGTTRSENVDLLVRLPSATQYTTAERASLVDPVAQVRELGDLVDRGLLSFDEYEHHRVVALGG